MLFEVTFQTSTGSILTTTTQQTIIESTTGTSQSISNQNCPNGDGLYPDKTTGCQKYYRCNYSGTIYQAIYDFTCQTGLVVSKN